MVANDLFEDNKIRVMSDEILQRMKDSFIEDEEYHTEMYNKYFQQFRGEPVDIDRLFSVHGEATIREISYYLLELAKQNREEYANPEIDYDDIKALLDTDLSRLPDIKDLSATEGLSFCDHFTKKARLQCPIVGKGNLTAYNLLFDNYGLYKAVLKAMYFHRTRVTVKGLLRTSELICAVVSNFKPVVAAKIWYEYGVKKSEEQGDDYIALHCPSEGWLGRLLSSYKIAYDNPHKKVYYVSTDPNPIVNRAGHEMIKVLGAYHDLPNWFPELHMTGSENFTQLPSGTNHKYHVSFTSPPYFNTEQYMQGFKVSLSCGNLLTLADNEQVLIKAQSRWDDDYHCDVPELEQGMHLVEHGSTITRIDKTGQSWDTHSSQSEWRINFLLATYNCLKQIVQPGGHIITNIANVKTYMDLEQDTVRSGEEAGLEYLGETWYKLSRKPSKNPGSEITARKGEPMFVFLRPF